MTSYQERAKEYSRKLIAVGFAHFSHPRSMLFNLLFGGKQEIFRLQILAQDVKCKVFKSLCVLTERS